VRYGPRRAQRVELTLPGGGGPHPVAVLLHGGFWRARYTLSLMRPLAQDLVDRGWAAYNVEYRRLGPLSRGGVPQTLDDVSAAIDAIADQPELDTTKVVAIGHSAGGHLALWAAGRTDARVPLTGAVGQAAVADLAEAERLDLGAGVVKRFARDRLAEADPIRRAPTGVPTLLVHGTDDDTVPPALSERYKAKAGAEVTLELRDGEGHFEHIDPRSGAWRTVTEWLT
jgi:acetyl esterase/lipase